MPLRIDDRTGSKELAKHFPPLGIQPVVTRLEFGDLDFIGNGPTSKCGVVVERKQIDDLVASIQSNRLSGHQLPGMAQQYDYGYLIVEGVWRSGAHGQLEVMHHGRWVERGMTTRAINNYVMGLALRAGMLVWRTGSMAETVGFVVDQVRMWEKDWAEHKAHEEVYAPGRANGGGREGFFLNLNPRRITYRERVALQLPGLDDKARWVEQWFGSIKEMANAGPETWANKVWNTRAKGGREGKVRKLGHAAAEKIIEALRGRD